MVDLKKVMIGLAVGLVIATIAAIAFAVLFFTKSTVSEPQTTTARPPAGPPAGWENVATKLSKSMNTSVNPCEDFYHFACGGYISDPANALNGSFIKNPVYDGARRVTEAVADAIVKINIDDSQTPRTLVQAKIAHQKCQHPTDAMQQLADFISIVYSKFNGWPTLSNSTANVTINFEEELGMLANEFGSGGWLGTSVGITVFDPTTDLTTLMLYVEPFMLFSFPGNPPATEGKLQAKIKNTTSRIFNGIFKLNISEEVIAQDATDVAEMMVKLDQLAAIAIGSGTVEEKRMMVTLDQANTVWPFFNWTTYLTNIAGDYLDPNELLQGTFGINRPNYLNMANQYLISLHEPKRTRVMQNLNIWQLYTKFKIHLTGDDEVLKQIFDEFEMQTMQLSEPRKRDLQCADYLIGKLPFPASRLYVDERFNRVNGLMPKAGVTYISEVVQASVHQMMHDVEWLTAYSKKGAYDKLSKMSKNIAYPEWLVNNLELDRRFMALNLSTDEDAFMTNSRIMQFHQSRDIAKIGSRLSANDWPFLHPTDVNSANAAIVNAIYIDAAWIDEPTYNSGYPMAFNYGAIGWVIGHEIMHSFSWIGANVSGDGLLHNWMDSSSYAKYLEMEQCVVDQYDHICYDLPPPFGRTCINGSLSMPDNMADNGGMSAAYRAYQRYIAMNGEEQRLPGPMASYSMEQIFFLSYANQLCTNIDPSVFGLFCVVELSPEGAEIGERRRLLGLAKGGGAGGSRPAAPTVPALIFGSR